MRRPSRPAAGSVLWVGVLCGLLALPALASVGSDPGMAQQWGLRQISAPAAWATSVGTGVPIAVIDTGVDLGHEDLRDQIAAAVTCVGTGGDARKCKVDGADIDGHGSHVAGIAAASSNDAGVAGVAPDARIVAVRVFYEQRTFDPLSGKESVRVLADDVDVDAGIRWVIANVARKGVINMSLGDALPVKVAANGYEAAVEAAWAAGWVPVLTAGNENDFGGLSSEQYGNLNAVVVGATGPSGDLAKYSGPFGSAKWGIVAPGGDGRDADGDPSCVDRSKCVLSTYRAGEYGFMQGTSQAAPHVSGTLALLMSAGLDNTAAVGRILSTTDRSKPCGGGCHGRLDAAKAVAGLAPASAATTSVPASPDATTGTAPGATPSSTVAGTRPRRDAPVAPPPATGAPALVPAPSDTTTTEAPAATLLEVPEASTSVTGLTLEEALESPSPTAPDGPDVPVAAVLAAAAAVLGAGFGAGWAWRRRWT